MRKYLLTTLALLSLGLMTATTASAQDPSGGFYGRGSLGMGFARTGFATDRDSFQDQDATFGGFAVAYDAALGFELPFGLAIHGAYRGWVTPSPKLRIGDSTFDIKDTRLALHNFGVGITFSPKAFFATVMMGPAFMKYKYDPDDSQFDVTANTRDEKSWGFGAEAGLGAMFLHTGSIGLGVGAFGSFHWIAETRDSEKGLLGFQGSGRFILEF